MRITNRSIFKPKVGGAYKIEASASEATVYLYDEIGWFGIMADEFVRDLNQITSGVIHLRVNSPGGSVFDGTTIYNALKQHKARIVAHIDGLAASIASVIVMAADEVVASENSFLMIHEPWSMVIGDSIDMRQEADLLDKVSGTISKTYQDKSGKSAEAIKSLMVAETWFTAQEALDAGFIDRVEGGSRAKATLFDLSAFANVPDELVSGKGTPTEREIEKALRDIGCSRTQSKAILAGGLPEELRDADNPTLDPAPVHDQRDAGSEDQREADTPVEGKNCSIADLLERANRVAPTMTETEKLLGGVK